LEKVNSRRRRRRRRLRCVIYAKFSGIVTTPLVAAIWESLCAISVTKQVELNAVEYMFMQDKIHAIVSSWCHPGLTIFSCVNYKNINP
jgi:hypothetical protein